MNWINLGKSIIGKVPLIGGLLKNATGELGTSVGNLISSALGIDNNADAIYEHLQDNPDAILKLKEWEMLHEEKLLDLAFASEELRLKDVQGARQREIGIVQATGKKDIHLYILSYCITGGFFGILAYLMTTPLPDTSEKVVFMIFGGLITAFTTVISYFFGSSKSSAEKTNLMSGKK